VSPHHADHLRGLTVFLDNTAGDEPIEKDVVLCPGARVYGYSICVTNEAAPEIMATLALQDSRIHVPNCCESTHASLSRDLPGLAWPAFAKLMAPIGSNVRLVIDYGSCS
jgi:hypothetical protein